MMVKQENATVPNAGWELAEAEWWRVYPAASEIIRRAPHDPVEDQVGAPSGDPAEIGENPLLRPEGASVDAHSGAREGTPDQQADRDGRSKTDRQKFIAAAAAQAGRDAQLERGDGGRGL